MSGLTITAFTKTFFDKSLVLGAMDRETAKALGKAGGRIRVTAQRSIKEVRQKTRELTAQQKDDYRKEVAIAAAAGKPRPKLPISRDASPPGTPPRSRTGHLKRFLLYGFDSSTRSVVVGPALLPGRSAAQRVLEAGGKTRIKTRGQTRTVSIAARPFMSPALQKNLSFIPSAFANSLR